MEGPTGVVPEELRRWPIRQPGQTGLGIGVGRGRGTGRGAKTCGEKHRPLRYGQLGSEGGAGRFCRGPVDALGVATLADHDCGAVGHVEVFDVEVEDLRRARAAVSYNDCHNNRSRHGRIRNPGGELGWRDYPALGLLLAGTSLGPSLLCVALS